MDCQQKGFLYRHTTEEPLPNVFTNRHGSFYRGPALENNLTNQNHIWNPFQSIENTRQEKENP